MDRAVRYALVTGGNGGVRSGLMAELAERLAARGLRVGGFVELRRLDARPGETAIELIRVPGRERRALAHHHPAPDPNESGGCSLVFLPDGFEAASRWLEEDRGRADVVLVDGIGKLELAGEGHRPALSRALAAGDPVVLLSVRDEQLVYALEALGLEEPVAAVSAADGERERAAFVERLAGAVGR